MAMRTKEDADRALKEMGRLQDTIESIELRESEVIRLAKERMVEETLPAKTLLADYEKALQKWAVDNPVLFPTNSRTLVLNFGKIWFRKSPPEIRLLVKAKTVLARLRAKRMFDCIRDNPQVNREALAAYEDDVLKELGCKKNQKDKFYYEVKREEVR